MIRGRWIYDERKRELVEAHLFHRDPPKRSHLAAPMVIGDSMDGVQSQLDGKVYTSKTELRRSYKQAGVVEIGNEKQIKRVKHRADEKGIRASLEKASAKVKRGEYTEKTLRKHV